MSEAIKALYRSAGLTPPKGKGIHKKKFHEMAIGIKKGNPSYSMSRAYSIAMGHLGSKGAVRAGHRRSK